jgi:hypothetical protein
MTPEQQSIHLVGRLAKLERELAVLREIFPKILDALGNGSGCLPSCSVEFMQWIPNEVRIVVTGLKRELKQEREQIAILRSDEKRLMQFTKTYRLRADEAEAKLEQERQDRKQAELDVCRALGERNDTRAELARLKATLADPAEVELAMMRGDIAIPDRVEFDAIRTPSGYNPLPTAAEIDAHLDECVARSERDWKELPGDPDVFYPRP